MKKYIVLLGLALLIGGTAMAQWNTVGNDIYNTNSGNVGIGLTAPTEKLHIENSGPAGLLLQSPYNTSPTRAVGYLRIVNSHPNEGDYLNISLRRHQTLGTEMIQSVYRASDGKFLAYNYLNINTGKYEIRDGVSNVEFRNSGATLFNGNGPVGIDVPMADIGKLAGAKLGVNGKILATEVEVKLFGNWPDFVFLKDYNLMPLNEVEQFINENGHLPNVPNEAQVKEDGINLGQMNAVLLQKIEELTLHIIDLNKRIAELEK
jgi:hypothetical protein